MIKKFEIDYTVFPQHNQHVDTHRTDDPVEAEEYLMHLLVSGARILAIKHEGVNLDTVQSDRLLLVAVQRLATRLLANSLHIDSVTVNHRFGLPA
ncbi:hypothetical protein [Verrucomicrobium spinosum]|uniref:hypothetical protein n=1 Tax=Verrucomicrobium spinosum TaxID=2736 RepID=UPI000174569E|nr:hypothetical protein [Verrucomicrobium spinosum]